MTVGSPEERIAIRLEKGDTFWRLAELKYEGRHPIAAIFAANGLLPKVSIDETGSKRMFDPVYHAGATYILPGKGELMDLTERFWKRIDEAYGLKESTPERVGAPDEKTYVLMHWDDTLWDLAGIKYGGSHPMDAIYEANAMTPQVVPQEHEEGSSVRTYRAPIVYAGHSYIFPARADLDALSKRFRARMEGME